MNEHPLERAIRADLDWVLTAPSLLAPHPTLWSGDALQNEPRRPFSAEQLASLSRARRGKLGRYFEALVAYLFLASTGFRVLAQNRSIVADKRTLGELDLLVQDLATGQIIHLELALKFYLWVPGQRQAVWIGSGLHDFMADKVQRLYQHQLRLPELARARQCWPSDLPYPTEHRLWMPGRLYVPESSQALGVPYTHFMDTPFQLNNQALVSSWSEHGSCAHRSTRSICKADWLMGEPPVSLLAPEPTHQLPAQFIRPESTVPVYVLPPNWQTDATSAIQLHKNLHD
ncbi:MULTISPECIES: DUF1853 family protein [Reinekea]|jgi:hypothetical protein|uniref:DUF1853 family protein n=1 Tax=Reinekea forsetii TaxID=1336806 RepID=A0A2K8KP53_9GAMM|nr:MULTISPECIES: DUF1853 family protein [Reinekea]ATX76412.1 hypothetical protein REIFOR_01266 [Reinekea forsetii]